VLEEGRGWAMDKETKAGTGLGPGWGEGRCRPIGASLWLILGEVMTDFLPTEPSGMLGIQW
jgi:hypothetical protein